MYLLVSVVMIYQYFLYVTFYDPFISVLWGTLTCSYFWISLNALLMMILDIYGHLLIIAIGIPIILGVVYNLRQTRLHWLMLKPLDKINSEVDALTQLIHLQRIIKQSVTSQTDNLILTGVVNTNVFECQDPTCFCKKDIELFDVASGTFSKRTKSYHKDHIFLNYYCKKMYSSYLEKFGNSLMIRDSFAHYLFESIRNVHAALVELNFASKKKPSLKQQFDIHRQKMEIEEYIKLESSLCKDSYNQLTNVVSFEELLIECRKSIDKVANYQIELWSQVANQLPDLNVLHDLGNKIYASAEEVAKTWKHICSINPNYHEALQLYGNYIIEIRNNNQLGSEILEK